MLLCIQNLVKFCALVLKILSGKEILRSIKGRNSVANLRNLPFTIPTLILSMLMCIQNMVKFCLFVLKILSGNENYDGKTERWNDRMTEGQTGQIQYSPHFFKAGL